MSEAWNSAVALELLTNALFATSEAKESMQNPNRLRLTESSDDDLTSPPSTYSSWDDLVNAESMSPERLVYLDQQVTKYDQDGMVYVGIPHDKISIAFVETIKKRAMDLKIECVKDMFLTVPPSYHGGQGGIVIGRDGIPRFVTAKHNLASKELEDGSIITCQYTSLYLQGSGIGVAIEFGDMNSSQPVIGVPLRDDATWNRGVDVSWGQEVTVEDLGQRRYDYISNNNIEHFEMIRADFDFQAHQKVGIAVYSRFAVATFDNAVKGSNFEGEVTAELLGKIFGPAGAITIYTGEITFVGEEHIEYSVNLYRGCSGAIVFLLDYDQPPSVNESDHGRAIAVHAGFQDELGTNLGFKFIDPQHNNQ
jgi:hypothetical protein